MMPARHRAISQLGAAVRLLLLLIGTGLVVGAVGAIVFAGALTRTGS